MLKLKILFFLFKICHTIIHENTAVIINSPEKINYYPNYNEKTTNAWKFLQTYTSLNPVVLLIDDVQQCHDEASSFLSDLHKLTTKIENVDFRIMKFNTSGVSAILESSKNNRRRFEEILSKKTNDAPSNFSGYGNSSKSAVFFGILNAIYALPPNSGVVVFINRDVADEVLAQHALGEINKKRIQVFVIWSGKSSEPLLRQLAESSHGAFLEATLTNLSQLYYEKFLDNIESFTSASLLLSRKNLRGASNLDFPIDSDVTGIHITIIPNVSQGILTTPRGYNIDLQDVEDVSQFAAGSFINRENGIHETHLNTTATQDVGFWHLRLNARALYNVTIIAHTNLTTNAVVTVENGTGYINKIVKLGLTGEISEISNISFVSEDGTPLLDNVKFSLDKSWENYLTESIDGVETNKKQLNVNVTTVLKGPSYAIVSGKDSQGNDFRRLSYVSSLRPKEFFLPPLTVETGLGSELITQPYRQPQLFFEVTNNGNSPNLVRFLVRDDRGILQSMNPWYRWISPQETATVLVTLTTQAGTYQDFITFQAAGTETVSKKVIVDVGINQDDNRDPELDYQFTSDCSKVLFASCEDGTWTVEVKAKDTGSGLLQVTSIPRGIYFPNGFTTGTKEEVTGFFSESCCNPDLKLAAVDRQNNRRVRQINAYRAALSPAAIAAIVIGIILLIVLIIVVVLLCRKCCKYYQKDSYDLPVYRGPQRT